MKQFLSRNIFNKVNTVISYSRFCGLLVRYRSWLHEATSTIPRSVTIRKWFFSGFEHKNPVCDILAAAYNIVGVCLVIHGCTSTSAYFSGIWLWRYLFLLLYIPRGFACVIRALIRVINIRNFNQHFSPISNLWGLCFWKKICLCNYLLARFHHIPD